MHAGKANDSRSCARQGVTVSISRIDMDSKSNLVVGIDASRVREGSTGVGRYTQAILRPLDKALPCANFILFVRRSHNALLPSSRWTVVCDRHPVWSRLPIALWVHYRLGRLVRTRRVDVLWASNSFIPNGLPSTMPTVATVFDLRHILYPSDLPVITRFAHRLWFASSVRKAKRVVSISGGTSIRMARLLGRGADFIARPSVPPLPVLTDATKVTRLLTNVNLRAPFLLTVGRSSCKNLAVVIRAVADLKRRGQLLSHQLVMVGPSEGMREIGGVDLKQFQWVRRLGRVEDELMAALYLAADVLVFPSIYEGFGIPVIEARAAGCRAVTTDSPELREAGGADVTYVEPTCAGVADGIMRALSLPRPLPSDAAELIKWDVAAGAMARAFQSAVSPTV